MKLNYVQMKSRQCEYKRFSNYVISPEKNVWDFKLLSILINEMRDWKQDLTNEFRIIKKSNVNKYFFFRYIHIDDPDSYLIIDIKDTIIVKISRSIMEKCILMIGTSSYDYDNSI